MESLANVTSLGVEEIENALVVVGDSTIKDVVVAGTEACGFQVVYAETPEEAFKRLKFHSYHLIILSEEDPMNKPLEKNPIFLFIKALPMDLRRQMFVLLISGQHKSQDGLIAFLKSVDLVINKGNIKVFRNLLHRGLLEHRRFYADFMDTLKQWVV